MNERTILAACVLFLYCEWRFLKMPLRVPNTAPGVLTRIGWVEVMVIMIEDLPLAG